MKISKLLATRQHILRQAHLANLAHAYITLRRLADRIATARLRGLVKLTPSDPRQEEYWPTLTALEGNQSVIEEYFADEELLAMADAVVLATESEFTEIEFRLEELAERFVQPLRAALDHAGIDMDFDREESSVAPEGAD
jgi:hypothetical protein